MQISGLPVLNGDMLHGDENGLISVPPCELSLLRAAVDNVRAREKKLMDWVRGPEFRIEDLRRKFLE